MSQRTVSGRLAPAAPSPQYGVAWQDRAAARSRGDLGPTGVPVLIPAAEADLLAPGVRLRVVFGAVPEAETHDTDGLDLYPDVESMLRWNGIDVDRLPPLRAPGGGDVWIAWAQEHAQLRESIVADPERARAFVIPGSPMDYGVSGGKPNIPPRKLAGDAWSGRRPARSGREPGPRALRGRVGVLREGGRVGKAPTHARSTGRRRAAGTSATGARPMPASSSTSTTPRRGRPGVARATNGGRCGRNILSSRERVPCLTSNASCPSPTTVPQTSTKSSA